MTRRHYSSTMAATTLVGAINNSQTNVVVGSVTGAPSFPYVLLIDRDTASEEAVLVTSGTGTSLTVTRGYDGTTGLSHSNGATVVHGATAIEFDEANDHANKTTGAHGISGSPVGTTDAQALTNKDLSSGTNTFPASLATDAEVASAIATAVPASTPRGLVASSSYATTSGATSSAIGPFASLTPTLTTGRRYRIRVFGPIVRGGTADETAATITRGTVLATGVTASVGSSAVMVTAEAIVTGDGLATAITAQFLRASGASNQNLTGTGNPAWFTVEDIGV